MSRGIEVKTCSPCDRERTRKANAIRRQMLSKAERIQVRLKDRHKEKLQRRRLAEDRKLIRLQWEAFDDERKIVRKLENVGSRKGWSAWFGESNYKIATRMRTRFYNVFKQNIKSQAMLRLLGVGSVEDVWLHFERQFRDGMTRDNYGAHWEVDHIRPCDSFDLSTPYGISKCFHISNMQPLEVSLNRRKSCSIKHL